jgi:hypothetical protein
MMSSGFSKMDLSAWLGLAVLLFVGWIAVMPFVAIGPAAHPLAIGATGLAFSAITATVMMRMFRTWGDTEASAPTATPSDVATFAYPAVLRRLLRFGLILWPLMFVLSLAGSVGALGERLPIFQVAMIVAVVGLLLGVYVLTHLVGEIRATDHGLDVRMASGRSISIGWHEIGRFRIGPLRDRFRVETKSGFVFSVEYSLPGFPRLLRLIEQRPAQAGGDG